VVAAAAAAAAMRWYREFGEATPRAIEGDALPNAREGTGFKAGGRIPPSLEKRRAGGIRACIQEIYGWAVGPAVYEISSCLVVGLVIFFQLVRGETLTGSSLLRFSIKILL